ncbi:MAG: histone deacetylase [Anaerolineae bacterium]|nr:histone deacetylase [Anaerolineae bacterium]
MTTAYVTDTRYAEHNLPGHAEYAGRLLAIHELLDQRGVSERMVRLKPESVSDQQILTVHTDEYLELLHWSETQKGLMLGQDTYVLPVSLEIARLSAGAAVRAVDALMLAEADNALAVSRPPGHHAVSDTGMGFCLLANVSLAAMHARDKYNLQRIMIMDIDVHHGNGTQDIFYEDPGVLFISTHQHPWYPFTGIASQIGRGDGQGYNINIPLPAGVGDLAYRRVYQEVIWQAARRYRPELILVSAGFDAHWADPLSQMGLTLGGYDYIVHELLKMAAELCKGRIAFVLEGGYNLTSLSHGVLNVAHALLGDDELSDPLGATTRKEPNIDDLLRHIKQLHTLA